MQAFHQLRRHQIWLALVSLAICLPWLALVGAGRCPLVEVSLPGSTIPSNLSQTCCPLCVTDGGHFQTPAPAPPAKTVLCCEVFKAGLPLETDSAQLKTAFELRFLDALADWRAIAFTAANDVSPDAVPSWSAPPPAAFLRIVTQRCFPSHAPPVSGAVLS